MANEGEYRRQLSEIEEIIAETRSGFSGGGVVALVAAALTALAVVVLWLGLVASSRVVWAAHNALLWGFVGVWYHYETRAEGRVSARGRSVLKLWAAITLAVWLMVWSLDVVGANAAAGVAALLPMLLGLGIFGTGLISESGFSQWVGVVQIAAGPTIAALVPHSSAIAWSLLSIVVLGLVWGAGSWLIREHS